MRIQKSPHRIMNVDKQSGDNNTIKNNSTGKVNYLTIIIHLLVLK